MGAIFLFLGCLVLILFNVLKDTSQQAKSNREYREYQRKTNFNAVRQFEFEQMFQVRSWEFEEQTGMKVQIIANILSARYDNVPYDPEVACFGGFEQSAKCAAVAYLLNKEGFNIDLSKYHDVKTVDLTIPEDYIYQGKLYMLSISELENLTGLNFKRLYDKFISLNERYVKYQLNHCGERAKGMMVRYLMEFEGKQFYGMHDYLFVGSKFNVPTGKDDVNDDFSLEDCKEWGTPQIKYELGV